MKLLFAFDGSITSLGAIEDLGRAGLGDRGEIRVLSVADVFLAPEAGEDALPEGMLAIARGARARAAAEVEKAAELAESAGTRIRTKLPGWSVETAAEAGSPAWTIVANAEAWKADLVVLGAVGRSSVERVLLGSVSRKVLTEASCSVRIGRPPRAPLGPLRLIVGVDGSSSSQAAARAAAARSWPPGTEAEVVSAVDSKIGTALAGPELAAARWIREGDADENAWIRRMAEESADLLRTSGLRATSLLLQGDPRRLLASEAERRGAACIFVGATGLSRLERLLLGSVSAAVAERASCSVEVVRSAKAAPAS